MIKEKIAISWSGGKDAMMALHKLQNSGEYIIDHLHTVIGEESRRVGMHGIHVDLMKAQAEALNIPILFSILPADESHNSYEQLMLNYCKDCVQKNIKAIVFGDIFLEDLKTYREQQLAGTGLSAIFPLWKNDTKEQIEDFLNMGFKTKICSGNAKYFSKDQVGKTLDKKFFDEIPKKVDPCGENGEFHTFVYDGPLFRKKLLIKLKEVDSHFYSYNVEKDGEIEELKSEFYFADFTI